VDHPRRRWAFIAVFALAFGIATAGVMYMAISRSDSAFVGLAILLFLPVPFFCWLAWRTRALLRKRP
jgi:hypothetical protein